MKLEFITFVLLVSFLIGCRKSDIQLIEPECRLVILGNKDSFNLGNVYFYYDNQNKLVGRAFYDWNTPSITTNYSPRFDTVIYNIDNSVTIKHYNAILLEFNEHIPPIHAQLNDSKTNITFGDNGIAKMVTTDISDKVISQKDFIYQDGKLKTIQEVGQKPLPDFTFNAQSAKIKAQTDYSISYDGNNIKSVISITKDLNNIPVGSDTILYKSYSNLKNPYKSVKIFWAYYFHSVSSNIFTESMHNYYYDYTSLNVHWFTLSGYSSNGGTDIYTNNGKDYPKEYMKLSCD